MDDDLATLAGARPDQAGSPTGVLRSGAAVGRFTVARLLGAGGMGEVYEARDPDLGRSVALKVLAHPAPRRELQLRLLREAHALAQVQHPNVVAVHEVGEIDGRVFVAMELIEGETLDRHLASRRPGWREIVALYVQAGRGLAAAHAKGLVHRDFKPGNVLIDREGRVRVTDFGLARLAEASQRNDDPDAPTPDSFLASSVTDGEELVGTPRYMAPELFARRAATSMSDQFSFCVALWEGLVGRHPFAAGADLGGLAATVGRGAVVPPPRGRIPRRLSALLQRGLRAAPDERHPSVLELLHQLENLPRRRRVALVTAGASLALTAAGVAAATVSWAQLPAPAADPDDRTPLDVRFARGARVPLLETRIRRYVDGALFAAPDGVRHELECHGDTCRVDVLTPEGTSYDPTEPLQGEPLRGLVRAALFSTAVPERDPGADRARWRRTAYVRIDGEWASPGPIGMDSLQSAADRFDRSQDAEACKRAHPDPGDITFRLELGNEPPRIDVTAGGSLAYKAVGECLRRVLDAIVTETELLPHGAGGVLYHRVLVP